MSTLVKKILLIIYFVVLFFILGSYIHIAIPDNAIRMHIVTADELSQTQHNIIGIQARNLDNGSVFKNWSVRSLWVNSELEPLENNVVTKKLSEDGADILDMPDIPSDPVAALEIQLIDPENHVIKSALVTSDVFTSNSDISVHGQLENVKPDYIGADAPATFILEQPNEVRLIAYQDEKPYEGTIDIEQIYGAPAIFPEHVKANPSGITKFNIVLNSAADFKITAGKQILYPSFVFHEKNIHVTLNKNVLTKESMDADNSDDSPSDRNHSLIAKVVPVGQMSTMYIDYFDENAWIDREIVEPPKGRASYKSSIPLNIRYRYHKDPSVLYIRVSSSAYATPDTAQTFAVLASENELSCKDAALASLKFLEPYKSSHPEYELLKLRVKTTTNCEILSLVQEEVLSLLAGHHDPQLAMRVKTEDADALAYDARKIKHKSVANTILVAWFALGVIIGVIAVGTQMWRRKQYWLEVAAKGEADLGKRIPQVSAFMAFLLLLLFIGLCVSLYYMMQLL